MYLLVFIQNLLVHLAEKILLPQPLTLGGDYLGSLHIDELRCAASDLAQRNMLAVHPVAGWWKSKSTQNVDQKTARFALVVELDNRRCRNGPLYGD